MRFGAATEVDDDGRREAQRQLDPFEFLVGGGRGGPQIHQQEQIVVTLVFKLQRRQTSLPRGQRQWIQRRLSPGRHSRSP